MSRLSKPVRLVICLSLLLALAVFYWQLGGSPALSPRRPLEQAQRRALLEPGILVTQLPAKTISEETVFVTKKDEYLRFVPLFSENNLWYSSFWTGASVFPLEENREVSFVPFQLQLSADGRYTHVGPAVFVYCQESEAESCQVCVIVDKTVYHLEPVAGENGFFFFPMEQMNQPEHRSNRRQILSILSLLSGQESVSHTLAVSLRATLYDKDGQILQTFSKHYLPQ